MNSFMLGYFHTALAYENLWYFNPKVINAKFSNKNDLVDLESNNENLEVDTWAFFHQVQVPVQA